MNAFIVDCNATQKWTNAETVIDTRLFPHYQNSNGAKDESVREKYHKYFILQKKSVFSLSFSLVTFVSLIHTRLMVRKKYNLISIDAFCTRKKKHINIFSLRFLCSHSALCFDVTLYWQTTTLVIGFFFLYRQNTKPIFNMKIQLNDDDKSRKKIVIDEIVEKKKNERDNASACARWFLSRENSIFSKLVSCRTRCTFLFIENWKFSFFLSLERCHKMCAMS